MNTVDKDDLSQRDSKQKGTSVCFRKRFRSHVEERLERSGHFLSVIALTPLMVNDFE